MKSTLTFIPTENVLGNFGWLCVRYEDTSYNKPERITLYWPVVEGVLKDFEETFPELETGKELYDAGNGSYYFYRGSGHYSPTIRLKDGGQTKPIKAETTPVPLPRGIKSETRWSRGHWEKYLKTKGWVAA